MVIIAELRNKKGASFHRMVFFDGMLIMAMSPALSAVIFTKPSCSTGECSALGYCPIAEQRIGVRSRRRIK